MTTESNADREAALANLSPEERAALEESELTPEEIAALEAIAGDDDDDEEDEGDPGATAAAPSEDNSPLAPATDDDAAVFSPRYQATLPDDFDAQMKAVDAREAELAAQFKAGEMDAEEFLAENLKINNQRREMDILRTKVEISREMGAQTAEQEWNWAVSSFIKKVKRDEGIDYSTDKDKEADFDNFVKVLAASAANADKDYEWFLSEAHKRTKVLHGIDAKVTTPKNDQPKIDQPAKPKPSRKPPTDSLPATLSHVPGSDGPGDVDDNEYADLDKLEGMEYERALARMPKDQRERYLKAA